MTAKKVSQKALSSVSTFRVWLIIILLGFFYAGTAHHLFSQTPIPDNDNFATRTPLYGNIVSTTGRNTGATFEPGEPDPSFEGGKSVWWTWTATTNASVAMTTAGSSFDTILTVFTGTSISNLVLVAFNDTETNTSSVTFNVLAGTAYQIAVDGAFGAAGNIALQLSSGPTQSPPTNDNFADRIAISGTHLSNVTGSNIGATVEVDEPFHADEIGQKSVWWTWTAPSSGALTLTTTGSAIDTLLAIYTGNSVGNLVFVAANDEDPLAAAGLTSRITCNVISNTTYQIAVDGFEGDAGDIRLQLDVGAPLPIPANDNFSNALVLSGSNVSTNVTNIGATYEAGEPVHLEILGGKSVWFKWTAPSSGGVTLTASNNLVDTLVCVYKGTSLANLAFVAGNDEDYLTTAIEGDSTTYFNVTAGQTYQIVVDGVDGSSGNFRLSLVLGTADPIPANDNFANRIALSGSTVAVTNSNIGATLEAGEPLHLGYYGGNSVWWRWTSPGAGFVTIDTIGSLFDTLLAVYTGSALTNLVAIAGDDESGGNYTSLVTFPTKSGITYQIAVDGYDGDAYDLALHIHFVPASYSLTVTTNPVGKGSVTIDPLPDQAGKYAPGSVVTLTATPSAGVVFSNWTGSVSSTNNPLVLSINSNKTLVAGFYVIPTTNVWTGASPTTGNWTASGNWSNGTPNPGDVLIFPAGASRIAGNTNDFSNYNFGSIIFGGSDYVLRGNSLVLSGGVVSTNASGTNTLSLNVQLSANQIFRCGNSGAPLVISGNLDVVNRALTMDTIGNVVVSGIISGNGSIIKASSGTLSLLGNKTNTFSGTTFVNQGTLELGQAGAALAGPLTIGDGGGGVNADVVRFLGNSQLAALSAVTVNASGKLDLNGFSGAIGSLVVNAGNLSTGAGTLALNGDVTGIAAATQSSISGNLSLQGAVRTFNVDDGSSPVDLLVTAMISDGSGNGGILKSGTGVLRLTGSNTYSGATTLNAGTLALANTSALGSTAQGILVNSNGLLSLEGINLTGETLSISGGTIESTGTSNYWSGNIGLANTSIISVATNAPLNLAGGISGTGGFTKTGEGKLILSGNKSNGHSGITTVAQGMLLLSKTTSNAIPGPLVIGDLGGGANADLVRFLSNFQIGPASAVTVNNAGQLDLNGFTGVAGSLTMIGGNVTTGAGSLGLNGNLTINAATTQAMISGKLFLQGATRVFDVADGTAAIDLLVSAVIGDGTGIGGITKIGDGTAQFSGTNIYSGLTTVNQGTVVISTGSAFGSANQGTIVNSNASVSLLGSLATAEPLALAGGTLFSDAGSNFCSGGITLSNSPVISVATNLTLNLSGIIEGAGALIKKGDGSLMFSGSSDNTFLGATFVTQGALLLNKVAATAVAGTLFIGDGIGGPDADVVRLLQNQQISAGASVILTNSSLLNLNNLSDSIGSVSGNGHIEFGGSGGSLTVGLDNTSTVYGGTITGAGQLIKAGGGDLVLNGDNSYTGQTFVNDGKLIVNRFQTGSSVTVNSPGLLGGSGHVGNLTSAGTVSPGTGPGVLFSGSLLLFSNATFRVELNGPTAGSGYDQLSVNGNVALAGTLNASLGFVPGSNDSFTLITNTGVQPIVGTFNGLPEGGTLTIGDVQFQISYVAGPSSNNVALTPVLLPGSTSISLAKLDTGAARIDGSGLAGQLYVLEAVDALNPPISWTPIITNSADAAGAYQLVDTNALFLPARFYRVKQSQ